MAYAADHMITVNGVSCYDSMYNEIPRQQKMVFISKKSLRVYLKQTEKANGVFPTACTPKLCSNVDKYFVPTVLHFCHLFNHPGCQHILSIDN